MQVREVNTVERGQGFEQIWVQTQSLPFPSDLGQKPLLGSNSFKPLFCLLQHVNNAHLRTAEVKWGQVCNVLSVAPGMS